MAFKRGFLAALAACFLFGSVALASGDSSGAANETGDSVIDRPPGAVPQYGRSNLPDSTLNGGLGFNFPTGGTTIPMPDPCLADPRPSYCGPPDDNTGGSGNPTPSPGTVEVAATWDGCAVISGGAGAAVSFNFEFAADGTVRTGSSCTRNCIPQSSGQWLPAGGNPARYSLNMPGVPTSIGPGSGDWINMGSGISGYYQARSTNSLGAVKRVTGNVQIRDDTTGAIVATRGVDVYLSVNGECL